MRNRTIAVLTIVVSLFGCDQSQVTRAQEARVTRIEIYYRNFDSLSPISQSKTDIVRVAPLKLSINEANPIQQFQELLPTHCSRLENMTADKVDYYLLAKQFSKDGLESEFGSSGLGFVDEKHFPGMVCQLSQHDREAIDAWLQTKQ